MIWSIFPRKFVNVERIFLKMIVVVTTGAVSDEGVGCSRSQEEGKVVEAESLFLGPLPLSSIVRLNPSVSQEKDQNLKDYISKFHKFSPYIIIVNLNHRHQQKMALAGTLPDLFVLSQEI